MNWCKLKIDGSAFGNLGKVGARGVIRDQNGVCVSGFARAIGIATSVEAELWALRDGSNICLAKNLKSISNRLGKAKFWRVTDTVHAKQALQQTRQFQIFL